MLLVEGICEMCMSYAPACISLSPPLSLTSAECLTSRRVNDGCIFTVYQHTARLQYVTKMNLSYINIFQEIVHLKMKFCFHLWNICRFKVFYVSKRLCCLLERALCNNA